MRHFGDKLKLAWLYMIELPWRHSGPKDERKVHWFIWLVGRSWAVAGMAGGAWAAPSLSKWIGVANTPYQDPFAISVAVLAGFLAQYIGWAILLLLGPPLGVLHTGYFHRTPDVRQVPGCLEAGPFIILFIMPFTAIVQAVSTFLDWVGPGQSSATLAFVGGLLVKTVLIPAIKGVVSGAALKWFISWLRGDKARLRGA